MDHILKDLRHALKLLAAHRGFTAAALLTLALCIGANTAMFSVVNSVLLRPLPFADADRLVRVFNAYPGAGVERASNGVPDYYDRLEAVEAFASLAMFQQRGLTIGESGRPERVSGLAATPSLFAVLGVNAAIGRTFSADEGEWGAAPTAILSHGLWQQQYAGAADVVGRTIRIDDLEHSIIGVMPPNFVFEEADVRVWVPLAFSPAMRGDDRRHNNSWESIARLKPGFTLAQAQAQLDAVNARNEERFPEFREVLRHAGFRTVVTDYRSDLVRDVRATLLLLQGGVLLVLLIGCVNVANLVLVRATARHRELATRSALGAPRRRLVRQLLTESVVLAGIGGAAGALLGWAAVRAFASLIAEQLPRASEISLDPATLGLTLLVAIAAGLLFGALPVARLFRADLSSVFRDEGRTGTASRTTRRLRGGLVVAQVSLACALLVGAGLLVASFVRALGVRPGFQPDGVLTAAVALPLTRYPDIVSQRQFVDRLLEQVRALPGVEYAAAGDLVLFGTSFDNSVVAPEGYVPSPEEQLVVPINARVTDGWFEAMGIQLIAGRSFTTGDDAAAPAVAIIDRTLAERFWPGQDPIGRRISQGVAGVGRDDELDYRTIVGVVERVRVRSLTHDFVEENGAYYIPLAQAPRGRVFVTLRAGVETTSLINPLRAAVTGIDPDLPLFDVRTMNERLATSLTAERVRMMLLVCFGALALFLAAVGLYGVLAYSVAQRSAEIGVRLALGSSSSAVFRLVLQQGARLVGAGLVIGIAASVLLAPFVRSMLFGVQPTEPGVYAIVLGLLAVTAFVACTVPALRATRVSPMIAMRE